MAKESKDGKARAKEPDSDGKLRAKEPEANAANPVAAGPEAGGPRPRTAIDEVIAAIESARDKVMSDEVKGLTKLGIPRAMAYQMVAARFHQNVVTDTEGGGQEFESSHWNDR
jgi:hypothetical protein